MATSIINLHGTEDAVFDDESLDLLKQFVTGRSVERRDEVLADKAGGRDGHLADLLIARYGTEDAALDDRDWELLDEWMEKGMPTGQQVQR